MDMRAERRERAIRWSAAAVSLLIHGILLFWLFHARYTIDTHPLGFEVRHVYLAPEIPLYYRNEELGMENMSPSSLDMESAEIPSASPSINTRVRENLSSERPPSSSFPPHPVSSVPA